MESKRTEWEGTGRNEGRTGAVDDIAGHEVARGDLLHAAHSGARHLRDLRLILFERFDGALSVAFLPDADACVRHENEEDHERLDKRADARLVLLEPREHLRWPPRHEMCMKAVRG